jgi:hypothetical protein
LWDARFTIVGRTSHNCGTHVPQLWDEQCPRRKEIVSTEKVIERPYADNSFRFRKE